MLYILVNLIIRNDHYINGIESFPTTGCCDVADLDNNEIDSLVFTLTF